MPVVRLEKDRGVGIITLDRPPANAYDVEFARELAATIDDARVSRQRRRRSRSDVGDSAAAEGDGIIPMRRASDDVDHRHVSDRNRLLPAVALPAGNGCNQQRDRKPDAGYLVRFTRQVPVCGAFACVPRVVKVPSIVSPPRRPVNVVSTGQSHCGSR